VTEDHIRTACGASRSASYKGCDGANTCRCDRAGEPADMRHAAVESTMQFDLTAIPTEDYESGRERCCHACTLPCTDGGCPM
jgi:hypothetical protein